MGAVLAPECERARSLASLGLDGELSQLEHALLRAHIGRCEHCAEFERDLGVLTQALRTAPLERPRRRDVPGRRSSSGVRAFQLAAAAAAAIVVAAGLGSLAGSLTSGQPAHPSATVTRQALRVAARSLLRPQPMPGTRLQRSAPV